jgi:hypothetical protein
MKKGRDYEAKAKKFASYNGNRNEDVEQVDEAEVPSGMKFLAAFEYKGTKHTYYRKGSKMSDPVVVHIDGKEWKEFASFPKAKAGALAHIKSMAMGEEVDKVAIQKQIDQAEKYLKTFFGNTSSIKMKKFAIRKKVDALKAKLKED